MHRISDTPRAYRHKCHTIEACNSVFSSWGRMNWFVCADMSSDGTEKSWYARSLADARDSIEAALMLEQSEAEGLAVLAGEVA